MAARSRLRQRLKQMAYWRRLDDLQASIAQLDRDLTALHALAPVHWGHRPAPRLGGWSLAPSALLDLIDVVERRLGRARVLELGGGMSTLMLRRLSEPIPGSVVERVTTIEHEPVFAEWLSRRGAEILQRPLVRINQHNAAWYGMEKHDFDSQTYNCLVVDGPPTSEADRSFAATALKECMEESCVVLVDDVNFRPNANAAQVIMESWRMEIEVSRPTYLILRR